MSSVNPACAPVAIPESDIKTTIGAGMVGLAMSFLCYGVTVLQVYLYCNGNKDTVVLRTIVGALLVLDTFQSVVYFLAMWHYAVEHFFDPLAILETTWSLTALIVVTVTTELLVRGVYCYRVWMFCKGWFRALLMVTVAVLSLTNFASALYYTINAQETLFFMDYDPFSWAADVSYSAGVTADILLAGTLVCLLRQRRTGFTDTESIIAVVTRFTINTGILTSSIALGVLAAYQASPRTFIFIGLYAVLSKVYVNSTLALLNSRFSTRQRSTYMSGQSLQFAHLFEQSSDQSQGKPEAQINVETTTWKDTGRDMIV